MNHTKIERILRVGEHDRVAFHSGTEDAELRRAVASAAAMANGTGGTIFYGVDAQGTPTRLFDREERQSISDSIMARVSEWTTPTLSPTADFITTASGIILAIHILPAANPPVMTGGVAYLRDGAANVEMTRTDLDRTIRTIPKTFDRLPMPGTALDDLDEGRLRRYIRQRQEAYPQSSPLMGTTEELWEEVKAVSITEEGMIPNVTGVLFFAREPANWMPHAGIKMARFQGKSHVSFLDRHETTGTLPELVELAEQFVRRHTKMASKVVGFDAVIISEYPYPALREALVNAFAHRDWEHHREMVQLNIFDDRIEIHSPGEPLLPIDQLEGAHASRNDNLCYLFKDIGVMEQYGTGVARMRILMEEHGLAPPRFETKGPIFIVTFHGPGEQILDKVADQAERVDLRSLGLNERQIEALRLLRNEGQALNNTDYRNLFGVSDRTALRDLKAMMSLGLVERIGSGPQSFYKASDDSEGSQ